MVFFILRHTGICCQECKGIQTGVDAAPLQTKGTMATCYRKAQSPQKGLQEAGGQIARHAREESTQGISVLDQQYLLATAESP